MPAKKKKKKKKKRKKKRLPWNQLNFYMSLGTAFAPYKIASAPSEDSGQPSHPRSLIRVFGVHLKTNWNPYSWLPTKCPAKTLIRLRVQIYENIPIEIYWNFYHQNMKLLRYKNSDIFHISAQNIYWEYSLEPPRRGGSKEYPQSMFLSKIKKNNVYPCKPQFYCIKVGFKDLRGSKLYRHVFVMSRLTCNLVGNAVPRLIFKHIHPPLLQSAYGLRHAKKKTKRVFGHMRRAKAQISLRIHAVWSGLTESLDTTECKNGKQRHGWYFAHAQDDLNLCEKTFSLGAPHIIQVMDSSSAVHTLMQCSPTTDFNQH